MPKQHPIATWNPERDYWETPEVDIFGHSVVYSATLPKSGMTRGGRLYGRPTSAPPTTGPASSSSDTHKKFPTPKAADGIMGRPRTTGRPIEKSTHLGTIVTLLPTPNATMGERGPSKEVGGLRPSGQPRQVDLNTVVVRAMSVAETPVEKHFPTPSARDGSSGGGQHPEKRRAGGHTVNLTDAVLECTGDNTPPLFDVGSKSSDPPPHQPN